MVPLSYSGTSAAVTVYCTCMCTYIYAHAVMLRCGIDHSEPDNLVGEILNLMNLTSVNFTSVSLHGEKIKIWYNVQSMSC